MGKGEIARYEQFLLFPQCFQKACLPGASKGVIVWEWVKVPCYVVLVLLHKKKTFAIRLEPLCFFNLVFHRFKASCLTFYDTILS